MMSEYIKEYLSRISLRYSELSGDKYEAVSQLQRQHLFNIPFENIDFNKGRRKIINKETIHQNLIRNKAGGMCTELNFSFHRLLRALRYDIKIISGCVKKSYFDHMILILNLDQAYLVDVGFGAYFFRKPVPLDGTPIHDISGTYRVHRTASNHFELQKLNNKEWVRQYSFYDKERSLEDFLDAWEWFYSMPNPFSLNTICRLDTPNGNISLYNNEFTVIDDQNDTVTKMTLKNKVKEQVLKKCFGLDYNV